MKNQKNIIRRRGFTLVELIVVVFIISALSSIIVLNYPEIVDKSKIKADIYSAKTITSAIKIYELDKGEKLNSPGNIVTFLVAAGYLDSGSSETPTCGGSWSYDATGKRIFIDGAQINATVFDSLSDQEKAYFKNTAQP